jgi:two-component system, OmpR family, KDP operon response regulator KdpE
VTTNLRILLIEDDASVRRFLQTSLATQDYEVIEAATAREGLALAGSNAPDVVLLDLGLPDMDGLDVIRNVREWSTVPIVVLSARGQERDKIAGLDAGADDYLTKPFGVGELLARIRAAQRRSARTQSGSAETEVSIGNIRIDLEKRQVFRDGKEVHLTPIEYRLLGVLIQYRGKVVTHRQILKEVWGPSYAGQTHYLRIFMLQLRRKLEQDPTRPRYLTTETGIGYRVHDECSSSNEEA